MKVAVFSAKPYDKKYLAAANEAHLDGNITLTYHDFALNEDTVPLAKGADAISVFVNDVLAASVLEGLAELGVRAILLRCAGYNNVDLPTAEKLGFFVANVPSYSPEAVAEFAVALIQTLNRHTHRAYKFVPDNCPYQGNPIC